jgi:hypothetical protein
LPYFALCVLLSHGSDSGGGNVSIGAQHQVQLIFFIVLD